jgi:hypothetical protein
MTTTTNPEPDQPSGPVRKYDAMRMFTDHLLDSLDEATDEMFNSGQPHFIHGWEDSDLKDLLPALTAQFERLWSRHNPSEAEADAT